MNYTAAVIDVLMAIVFVVIGFNFVQGRGVSLIMGLGGTSERGRRRYNEQALCKFIGKVVFVLALCMLLCAVGEVIHSKWFVFGGLILLAVTVLFSVFYVTTSKKLRNR